MTQAWLPALLQVQSSLSIHSIKARKENEADNNCGCQTSAVARGGERANTSLFLSVGIRCQSSRELEIQDEFLCAYLQSDSIQMEGALE